MAEIVANALTKLGCLVQIATWQQKQELVASQATTRFIAAQVAAQDRAQMHQGPVASVMTECVVDAFEVVEIDGDERERGAAGREEFNCAIDEGRPVEQASQSVCRRLHYKLSFTVDKFESQIAARRQIGGDRQAGQHQDRKKPLK